MDLTALANWLFQQAIQQIAWIILMSFITAIGLTALVNRGLDKLHEKRKLLWFFGSSFLVSLIFISLLTWRPKPLPDFRGEIIQMALLKMPENIEQKGAWVELTASVENSGLMQSIAKGWKLTASVDGRKYEGESMGVPQSFTLLDSKNHPNLFRNSSLVERARFPIPAGGAIAGVMLFRFANLDADFFRNRSPTFKLTFQDINSKESFAQMTLEPDKMQPEITKYVPGVQTFSDTQIPPVTPQPPQTQAPDVKQ